MQIQLTGKIEGLIASEKYRLRRKFKKIDRFTRQFPADAKKGELYLGRDPQNRFCAKLVFWVPNKKIVVEESRKRLTTAVNMVVKKAIRQIRRHKRELRSKS